MEDVLRDLQQVMAAHRRALAQADAPSPVPAAPPEPDPRPSLLQRLASDLERVSGIAMTGLIAAKLARVLGSVPLAELAAWVERLQLLPGDDPEWLSLIESVTVHETFFHRDHAQLDLLMEILRGLIDEAAATGRRGLRLWSAGCATGEEAYTLAILGLIAMRDAGVADNGAHGGIVCRPPWRLDVLGTDISRLVLTRAKAGVYSTEGLSAFRDLPRELRHFFPLLPTGAEAGVTERRGVLPSLQRHVRFRHGNLMAAAPPETGFDAVLCRNVLIYLTETGRRRAQMLFEKALRPGGYLLLGPTDVLAPGRYEARWGSGAVAYRLRRQP